MSYCKGLGLFLALVLLSPWSEQIARAQGSRAGVGVFHAVGYTKTRDHSEDDQTNWGLPLYSVQGLSLEWNEMRGGRPWWWFAQLGFPSSGGSAVYSKQAILGQKDYDLRVDPKIRWVMGFTVEWSAFVRAGLFGITTQGEQYDITYSDRKRNLADQTIEGSYRVKLETPHMLSLGAMVAFFYDLESFHLELAGADTPLSHGHLTIRSIEGLDSYPTVREYIRGRAEEMFLPGHRWVMLSGSYRF